MCNTIGTGLPSSMVTYKPKIPTPPDIPTRDDPAVKEAGKKERRRRLKAKGRSSTILTGGQGVTEAANIGRKTLLGQ